MDKTLEECYITLGLSSDATKEEVRRAYKKLALKCHPDKHQNSPEANRKFQELGYAYKRIAEDEELEEINEDCSEFDYWMEVFFYCLLKEHVQVQRNTREHCCPNCAQQDCDEDEEFLDGLYKKHKRKQREMTFTDEEMRHFVKFNSLKEQREFNKKIFCDSKKSSKPKNEPKVQKVKMKTNKQLKAEQWKREKEISMIGEEIDFKKKQEEQKIEHAKECKEMKKEKEKLECTENGIENEEQVNENRKQGGTRSNKEQLSKGNHRTIEHRNNVSTKEKTKKKHKKERVKTEDNNTQKFERQQPQTCKSTTPAAAKPAATKPATSSGIKRNSIPSKLVAPVFRPSKPAQQPAERPTPITSTQPPNIWTKRLETQNEIREIQPTNEEEELRQLEIALEMSKKQVEIEQQQKQISALQEEIRLMTLEQEKLQEQSPEKHLSDTCEADTLLDSAVKSDMLTDAENLNERLSDNDKLKLNEVSADLPVAKTNEQDKKQLNISCDSGAMDNSNQNECDFTSTHEVESTLGAKYAPVLHEPQEQYLRPRKNSKHQTQACASREKINVEKNKPCPYGRNCCLGKKCKYSHFLAKGGGGVDTKIIDVIEHNKSSTSSQVAMANQCEMMENHLLVTEDWDNEIENNKVLSSASNLLHGLSSSSSVTELSEPWQKGQNSCSVESKGGEKDSNGCEEKEYEKKPVIYLQFDVTNAICATEDWDHEVEDSDVLDPTVTRNSFSHLTLHPTSMTERPYEEVQGNSFSQTKYPTSMTERPHEEVQEFKAITSDDSMPIDSKTSYTIQPSVPHIIHCGEGSLNCHDGKDKEISKSSVLIGENAACLSSTCHEKTDTSWEEQSCASNNGPMNDVHIQEACREWQREWDVSLVEDAMRMGINDAMHSCNDVNFMGKQSRNITQQAVVEDARIKPVHHTLPITCHPRTAPGMCPVITDSDHSNPCTNSTQGPQHCLPFPSVGMPSVIPGGTVMHQPGLYNTPQVPSLFIPQLNYPYVQLGGSEIQSQANLLPKIATGYHPGVSNKSESSSASATSESGTLKPTCNSYSSISSTKQVPHLTMPNFPVLQNMYFGFQGNTPNVCTGVPPNMNSVPNIQQSPLMAVPFPLIPGFLPALPHQSLLTNNVINMSSTVGKESNNLQTLNKFASGPVNDYSVNYKSSPLLNPSKESRDWCTVNGQNPIQSNPLIALESNYHALLEMQMNGAPQNIDISYAKEHQTSTLHVGEGTSQITPDEKKICDNRESEYRKKNEDMLKLNDIRKPLSVPKALSYAERHH